VRRTRKGKEKCKGYYIKREMVMQGNLKEMQ
jgi:hypothetical protein